MKKDSSFNRVILSDDNSEEGKSKFLEDLSEDYRKSTSEFLPNESEKTVGEVKICERLNIFIDKLAEIYGGPSLEIIPEQIHIFNTDDRFGNGGRNGKLSDSGGHFDSSTQNILIDRGITEVSTAHKIAHEMIHKKSYGAIQITMPNNEGDSEVDFRYRVGFQMKTRDGKQNFFTLIEEALTEELSMSLMNLLSQEGIIKVNKDPEIMKSKGFDPREVQETYPNGILLSFVYKKERDALRNLINKITGKNSELTYEEVFEMFCRGKFSGNVLEIGKLIERTFGLGTLRKLAIATADYGNTEDFTRFVEGL